MIPLLPRVLALLGERRIILVFVKSVALTLALLVAAWLGLDSLLSGRGAGAVPDWMRDYWVVGSDWAALPIIIILTFFLFPAIATGVMTLFLDDVVDVVEGNAYAAQRARRAVGVGEQILLGLAAFARLLLWNIALLPLYIILLFTAIGPAILFIALNGWLMGRDLLEMVAIRHMPRREAAAFVRANMPTRIQLGGLSAPMYLVPVLNLAAPVLSAALAAHAFHITRGER